MKVVVTGASGFVGGHLVAELVRGHEVVSASRTPGCAPDGAAEIVVGDIDADTDWSAVLQGVDAVVHLAARVHVMNDTADDALAAYRSVNTDGTLALARAAAEQGVRRFVFVSSIKVNGEATPQEPFTRESIPAPVDPYGVSKLEAEQGLFDLAQASALEVVCLRPTVVYGPGVGGNIARIASAVTRGIPLPLGSINNRRSMTAVHNLVRAIEAGLSVNEVPTTAVLVADPEPVSTAALIRLLADGMNSKARLFRFPVGLLRLGATVLGRGADVARLVDDLVVEPDWVALGVDGAELRLPHEALPEVGRWLAKARA